MMKKTLTTLAAVLSMSPAIAQNDFSNITLKTTKVADGLYMLEGAGGFAGGNIGVSVGEDGVFIVDDQVSPMSDKILAAIRAISDKPIEFLLNTHYHGDHTGSNEFFGEKGAHIVAHENVRKRLMTGDAPTAASGLPVITFNSNVAFYWNGEMISVTHPTNAHTDGDAIIRFEKARVTHMGDVFFSGMYPYIDVDSGGSLDGYLAALESVAATIHENEIIIPGHGPLSSKADLLETIALLKEVRTRISALIDEGLSEDEVWAADPLADFHKKWAWSFITAERMTRIAYRSLSQN